MFTKNHRPAPAAITRTEEEEDEAAVNDVCFFLFAASKHELMGDEWYVKKVKLSCQREILFPAKSGHISQLAPVLRAGNCPQFVVTLKNTFLLFAPRFVVRRQLKHEFNLQRKLFLFPTQTRTRA